MIRKLFGLEGKFRLVIALFLVLIFGSITFVLVRGYHKNISRQISDQAKSFADLSGKPIIDSYDLYFNSGNLKFKEILDNLLSTNQNVENIQIINMEGNILFDSKDQNSEKQSSGKQGVPDYVQEALKKDQPTYIPSDEPREIILPYVDDWGTRRYGLRYFVSYADVQKNAFEVTKNIAILAVASLILSMVIISWLVGKLILDPIEKVASGAVKISQGDLSHEIKVSTHDETAELALAVNSMARKLQSDITKLQKLDKLKDEFIAIASHNLGTPLTTIKGYVNLFLKTSENISTTQKSYLDKVNQNVDQLSKIVEDLLSVVSFESGNQGLIKTPVDAGLLIAEAVEVLQEKARLKKISLTAMPANPSVNNLMADKFKIKEVLEILLENAIEFTSPGGKVEAGFVLNQTGIVFYVRDNGIGITQEEIPNLFQKFHRGTDILKYNHPGEGLSLYIAKLIVNAHGGAIWVGSELNQGSTFCFSLPYIQSPNTSG